MMMIMKMMPSSTMIAAASWTLLLLLAFSEDAAESRTGMSIVGLDLQSSIHRSAVDDNSQKASTPAEPRFNGSPSSRRSPARPWSFDAASMRSSRSSSISSSRRCICNGAGVGTSIPLGKAAAAMTDRSIIPSSNFSRSNSEVYSESRHSR